MKQSSISNAQKSMSSRILCCASEKVCSTSRIQRSLEEQSCRSPSREKATEIMMLSTESRLNSSGTFSPGFTTLQLCDKISDLLSYLGQTPENFSQEEFYLCQCSMTSLVTGTTTKMNVLKNDNYVKTFAGRFGIGQWSFIGPGS